MKPRINPVVFSISAILTLVFVALGAVFTEPVGRLFEAVQDLIISHLGWLYVVVVAFFLVFVVVLFVSPFGQVRLGKDGEQPEYTGATWFAMLFSAGMGIGLLFFSVAEPVLHFIAPRDASPGTIQAAEEAMAVTFLHWGLHAWAIYIVVGLSLAYFAYRHDLPLTIRSALYPLLGKRVDGTVGNVVEIMAVLGTLFGVATSLGLGAMQIGAGLEYLGIMKDDIGNQLILIAVITLVATASVASGLDRGVRRLSQLNLGIGLVLVVFVFLAGPTVFLLSSFVEGVGRYLQGIVQLTLRTDAFHGTDWQASWTMFYWAWWISWSPFVGMFIARISRGRTIREFIAGVLLVPTLLTFIWLVVLGNTAIFVELFGAGGIAAAVQENTSVALFALLEQLPWAGVTVVISTLVIATFFITSSDSGSLVIDKLTSSGELHRPVYQRIFWALVQGGVAIVLLLAGGLVALQTAVLTMALPFSIIMVAICYSLVKGLRTEREGARLEAAMSPGDQARRQPRRYRPATVGIGDMEDWRLRLRAILQRKEQDPAQEGGAGEDRRLPVGFIRGAAVPAFEALREELRAHGREVLIDVEGDQATITVFHRETEEFSYALRVRSYQKMATAFPEMPEEVADTDGYFAEVLVHGEPQDMWALEEFDADAILNDFLDEYEKWAKW